MPAKPQSIGIKLFAEINDRVTALAVTELDVRRWKKGADALMRDDPVGGLIAMAAVHAVQGNARKACEFSDRALKIEPNRVDTLLNYAASLERLCLLREAGSKVNQAFQLAPTNDDVVERHISSLVTTGSFVEAFNLCTTLTTQQRLHGNRILGLARELQEMWTTREIPTESLSRGLHAVFDVLRGRIPYLGYLTTSLHEGAGDEPMVRWSFGVPVDANEVLKLNIEIATALACFEDFPVEVTAVVTNAVAIDGHYPAAAA